MMLVKILYLKEGKGKIKYLVKMLLMMLVNILY
jgi:hypothetical protein